MEQIQEKIKQQGGCCSSCDGPNFTETTILDARSGTAANDISERPGWIRRWPLLTALAILLVMLTAEYGLGFFFPSYIKLIIYSTAYLLSGYDVLTTAYRRAIKLDFFNEFFLMSVATIGAFVLGSYSEGVAVMVFYSIGEWFQDSAVNRAKKSIKALLDVRPDTVSVIRDGKIIIVSPSQVKIGETIQVKAGEKVALDGVLLSDKATFNMAALTGESKPDNKSQGDNVLAGMINLDRVSQVQVKALFRNSKLSRILEMVQEATTRKSKTQLFISRFAKVYTPVVFALAVMVIALPYLFVSDYIFRDWLYRGLVFLVISCPCALVVSIPLGYFGGIGLASRNGILFKGSNFLDVMTKIDTVVLDKTGTLTKGVFRVQKVVSRDFDQRELIRLAAAIESKSTHPIAKAIIQFAGECFETARIEQVQEIAGCGLKGKVDGLQVLAGNVKLLKKFNVEYDNILDTEPETVVLLAIDGKYAGYILIADEIKQDSAQLITDLHKIGIETLILSGDKQSVVGKIGLLVGVDQAIGDLLPEDKAEKIQDLKDRGRHIAFAGDGFNDAPVIALADAGIAMGGLGSDVTIETADIVIQNDQPSKIVDAIRIGRLTKAVVWQNIGLAVTIKIGVLILGAGGIATLWEAVIADVGVAVLAILNAVRIQTKTIRS